MQISKLKNQIEQLEMINNKINIENKKLTQEIKNIKENSDKIVLFQIINQKSFQNQEFLLLNI